MGLMDDAMRADAQGVSDTDEFGETITYTRADATVLTPTVIIDRNAPARDPEYPVNGRIFDVQIAYDAADSVGLSSPPAQGDRNTVKTDPSDAGTVAKEFIGIVTGDAGGWLVQFGVSAWRTVQDQGRPATGR